MPNNNIENNNDTESKIISDAIIGITINTLFNNYALENAFMGFLNSNEKIPLDKYATDLKLQWLNISSYEKQLEGFYIDKDKRLIDINRDNLLFDFFSNNIYCIFNKIMNSKYDCIDNEYTIPCSDRFNEYFLSIFPLFKEIANMPTNYEFSDIITNDSYEDELNKDNIKFTEFIVAVILNGLRQGKCVNRYLKDVKHMSFAVNNIIKVNRNKYFLTKDPDSIEYKLALFSVFNFINRDYKKIFNLKIKHWYESKYQ